jgi:hypothetical protein
MLNALPGRRRRRVAFRTAGCVSFIRGISEQVSAQRRYRNLLRARRNLVALARKPGLVRGLRSFCCDTLGLGLRSFLIHLPLQLCLEIILLLFLGTLLGLEFALYLLPLPRQLLFLTKLFLLLLPFLSFRFCFLNLHLPEQLCLQFVCG